MEAIDKKKIRDYIRFLCACICFPIYLPHIIIYMLSREKKLLINSDVAAIKTDSLALNNICGVLYLLHNDCWFRRLFYYRIGPVAAMLISWWRPGDKSFIISYQSVIGPGVCLAHPYATVLNAESIGSNFTCIHCTTIGRTEKGRPIIGNNVILGANVTIIGPVRIGNNVKIGAGSVVVKDIPDNSVAVGNPAKVIKTLPSNDVVISN